MKRVSKQETQVVKDFFKGRTVEVVKASRNFQLVPLSEIRVDREYQRKLDRSKVNKIKNDFMWDLVSFVKVNHRDGKFYVFDGQHTVKAIEEIVGDPEYPIECIVYEDLPYEVEVALFSHQTGYSTGLSVRDEFKADEVRGIPDVVETVKALSEAGIPIKSGGTGSGMQRNGWIVSLYNTVGDRNEFITLMDLVYRFDDKLHKEIVFGVYEVRKEYKGMISDKRLMDVLADMTVAELRGDAARDAKRYKCSTYKAVAYQLVEAYTKKYRVDIPRYIFN